MADSPEGTLRQIHQRLDRIEKLLPSLQARLKTVERNAPLEVRLRALEQRVDNQAVSNDCKSWNPFSSFGGAIVGFGQLLIPLWHTGLKTLLSPLRCTSIGAPSEELQQQEQSVASISAASGEPRASASLKPPASTPPPSSLEVKTQAQANSSSLEAQAQIKKLHREACARGMDTYKDPATGFDVFTSNFLRTRDCCGSGCRHCPWGHRNVPSRRSLAIDGVVSAPKSTLYTRKGDTGWTNLYNENWILKSELVYDAIGDVDELNSAVGLARAMLVSAGFESGGLNQQLEVLQGWLLDVGSTLCTPRNATQNVRKLQRTSCITEKVVADLETWIDHADNSLRLLRNFILPGGSMGSGALHLARTICRRAERHTWPLILQGHAEELIGVFLNRLSDYLFVVARLDANQNGSDEQEYGIERKHDRWQRQIHTAVSNESKEAVAQ